MSEKIDISGPFKALFVKAGIKMEAVKIEDQFIEYPLSRGQKVDIKFLWKESYDPQAKEPGDFDKCMTAADRIDFENFRLVISGKDGIINIEAPVKFRYVIELRNEDENTLEYQVVDGVRIEIGSTIPTLHENGKTTYEIKETVKQEKKVKIQNKKGR